MAINDPRKKGQLTLIDHADIDDLEINRRKKHARTHHRNAYWREVDKSTYRCPDCERGIGDVSNFEVHHVDRNPMNGDPENLVALCVRCHYKRHGRQPPETVDEWKDKFLALGESS